MPYFGRLLPDRSIDADPLGGGLPVVPTPGMTSAFGLPLVQSEVPVPEMQLSFPYNINDRQAISTVAAGGTVTQAAGHAVLQTSANVAGSAQIESHGAVRYTPGQGIVFRATAIFTLGVANSRQEIGIGNVSDGFFFGYQGAAFGIFRRNGGVDTFVAQSAWNGRDRFDGNGPSGATLDPTKGNVYQIRFQWLGYGAIRFFVEDPTTGYPALVHTIFYANANTSVSVLNPTLSLHARAVNLGNASNLTLRSPSMGAFCEGDFNSFGVPWSFGNRKVAIGVETAVFSIRNDVTVFGGAAGNNRARLHVNAVTSGISNAQDGRIRALLNTTLGGVPAFAALDANRSIVSVDVAGTTVAGGFEVYRWAQSANTSIATVLSDLEIRLAPGDVLTFAATGITGNINADIGLQWHEEI